MSRLEVLIGNIASGKSLYAKKRAREGWFVVCDDSIINMLFADQYSLYSRSCQPLVTSLMQQTVRTLLLGGHFVVVDSTWNAAPEVFSVWQQLHANPTVTCFPREVPEVHAQRRMKHDSRDTSYEAWLEVAQRIDASLQLFESKNISL